MMSYAMREKFPYHVAAFILTILGIVLFAAMGIVGFNGWFLGAGITSLVIALVIAAVTS